MHSLTYARFYEAGHPPIKNPMSFSLFRDSFSALTLCTPTKNFCAHMLLTNHPIYKKIKNLPTILCSKYPLNLPAANFAKTTIVVMIIATQKALLFPFTKFPHACFYKCKPRQKNPITRSHPPPATSLPSPAKDGHQKRAQSWPPSQVVVALSSDMMITISTMSKFSAPEPSPSLPSQQPSTLEHFHQEAPN